MMSWLQHRWTGLYLLICGLGSLILFLYGFFPLKYSSGKLAHMDDLPNFINNASIDGHKMYYSGDNVVVLMIIDGLRYDFVTEKHMPYTGQLLKNKSACIYESVAEPPTVTMPRIKAMMTGSVSTYADVALNFGASAVKGDSVLRAAASREKRSVLYGDNTWLKLFPGLWAESDGTTSFFITDYNTEVDNNVTRHLNKVLSPDDKGKPNFDFLVLHYLGLDHIGHFESSRSPKIKPKLIEMDNIVKKIHTAMMKWDKTGVLFICGDHGMLDAGGHGGTTPAEVLVPIVVIKSQDYVCPYPAGPGPTVAQVDLAPTVAWLLNVPIPGDSTGRILPSLLPRDTRQHLYLLHIVASHNALLTHLPTDRELELYKQFERAEKQFAQYLATGQQSAAKMAKEFYDESLDIIMTKESNVDFDMFAIWTAILLVLLISTALLCLTLYSFKKSTTPHRLQKAGTFIALIVTFSIIYFTLTIACFISATKSLLCHHPSDYFYVWGAVFTAICCVLTFACFIMKTSIQKTDLSLFKKNYAIDYLLIGGTLFHPWLFIGTSYIQEEHMTWYFFWNTLMFLVFIRNIVVFVVYLSKKVIGATEVQELQDKPDLGNKMLYVEVKMLPKWICLIVLHRYLRTLHQTGDRCLFLFYTADCLTAPENATYLRLYLLVGTLATLLICLKNLQYLNNVFYVHTVLTIAATVCILCYRVTTQNLSAPFEHMTKWDTVAIVDIFWMILTVQALIEIATYANIFRAFKINMNIQGNDKFVYKKPKKKNKNSFYESLVEEPWNLEDVKLNLARSLSHLMLNDIMLIVVLLMRPHNVIMVPSVYITCLFTSQCMDHTMLDAKAERTTEIIDELSRTLVHLWIGSAFFFYQGNSNTLPSVDLTSGYVGLREYRPVRVALQIGLHAYSGPALAGAALIATFTRANTWPQYRRSIWRATNIFAFHRMYCVTVYCIVAATHRYHLYIWSVFSPKLLYEFAATVFTLQALLTIALIIGATYITSGIAKIVTYKMRLFTGCNKKGVSSIKKCVNLP